MSDIQRLLIEIQTRLTSGILLSEDEAHMLVDYISDLEGLCDSADQDDYFGTEGWRHHMGID